jgi:ADP-dependent NAD(P)H-hydrate dehydratase
MSARAKTRAIAVTPALLRRWPLPGPGDEGDKQTRGVAMIIGGASEVPGALLLAGVAALRAGAGKLQLAGPAGSSVELGIALPEARVFPLPENSAGRLDRQAGQRAAELSDGADALLVGPGMLGEDAIQKMMEALLPRISNGPLVLDASALAALRGGRHRFSPDARVLLTPNYGEMARLIGDTREAVERDPAGIATTIARTLDVVVALKGPETFIATPDGELFQYSAGKVGLATSGSGDVLAGIAVGLLARGATAEQAGAWAVYIHGEAGNRLIQAMGPVGFLARELLPEIPRVLKALRRR